MYFDNFILMNSYLKSVKDVGDNTYLLCLRNDASDSDYLVFIAKDYFREDLNNFLNKNCCVFGSIKSNSNGLMILRAKNIYFDNDNNYKFDKIYVNYFSLVNFKFEKYDVKKNYLVHLVYNKKDKDVKLRVLLEINDENEKMLKSLNVGDTVCVYGYIKFYKNKLVLIGKQLIKG